MSLNKLPADDAETDQLFKNLNEPGTGTLPDGWGEVSTWPAERITAGDWTAAAWRSPELADAAATFAARANLTMIGGGRIHKTGPSLSDRYRRLKTRTGSI